MAESIPTSNFHVFSFWKIFDVLSLHNYSYTPKESIQGRKKWSVVDLVQKFNLGNSIGGNFFQAEYDDYVPTLHTQIDAK